MGRFVMAGSLVLLMGSLVLGQTANPPKEPPPIPSCQQIIKTCEQAGYKVGMHDRNGKGLHVDCVDPVLAGKRVKGVTVAASLVTDCKTKRAARARK